jgi:4-hydroxythreonine-4-phosphate dehydrogenase
MNYRPIIIVAGEPNSIFLEIFFKALKYKKYKSPIILICSLKILNLQMKSFKINKKIKILEISKLKSYNLNNRAINLIDVNFDQKKAVQKNYKYI